MTIIVGISIHNSVIQSATDQCFTPNIQQIDVTSEQNQNHGQLVKNDDLPEKLKFTMENDYLSVRCWLPK
jgi:hypothetical protein